MNIIEGDKTLIISLNTTCGWCLRHYVRFLQTTSHRHGNFKTIGTTQSHRLKGYAHLRGWFYWATSATLCLRGITCVSVGNKVSDRDHLHVNVTLLTVIKMGWRNQSKGPVNHQNLAVIKISPSKTTFEWLRHFDITCLILDAALSAVRRKHLCLIIPNIAYFCKPEVRAQFDDTHVYLHDLFATPWYDLPKCLTRYFLWCQLRSHIFFKCLSI